MTLEEVICHLQHVEAEATPEFLMAEKSKLFPQMSMNVCLRICGCFMTGRGDRVKGWKRKIKKSTGLLVHSQLNTSTCVF